ncbi:MAG TPA: methyltransferase domain-containing protein [Acidimicrobiia bacterium]|nr:methyltransferase domain-containing protein [Acidimicrobiia bacterium]
MGFEVAADAYDQFMGRWSQHLSPQLVEFAGIDAGHRVLDVGCGPGALTSELVNRVGPSAVAAVDPSQSFVTAAQQRNPGVDVRLAAAERLPFRDGSFDAALAQLVVHFMTDPLAGLAEMARVTRPGGVIAASVWDFAGGHGPLGPFWTAARALDPGVEDESTLAGVRDGHLTDMFRESGLRSIEQTTLAVTQNYTGFEEWWGTFMRGVGPAGSYLTGLEEHQQAELREKCRAMLPAGSFTITARAWTARGNT